MPWVVGMTQAGIRLGVAQKAALYTSLIGLWATGALWLLFHYFFQTRNAFGTVPHGLEKWWLSAHGLAAMVTLVMLGSLLPNHICGAWRKRNNRASGAILVMFWLWLAVTGYALYYLLTDTNAVWLPALHWVPGLVVPVSFLCHLGVGRGRC